MKFRPKKQQVETLLQRPANRQRQFSAPPPRHSFVPSSGWKRPIWEAALGVLAALPVGMWLYFFVILVWAEVITALAIPILLIPYAGSVIMTWANFSTSLVSVLFGGAVLIEVFACRALIRCRYPVLAYTQGVLGLAVSLPFYYWTAVYQKPMLPFWGQ